MFDLLFLMFLFVSESCDMFWNREMSDLLQHIFNFPLAILILAANPFQSIAEGES